MQKLVDFRESRGLVRVLLHAPAVLQQELTRQTREMTGMRHGTDFAPVDAPKQREKLDEIMALFEAVSDPLIVAPPEPTAHDRDVDHETAARIRRLFER